MAHIGGHPYHPQDWRLYGCPPKETPEQLALRALQALQVTVEQQKAQIADMREDVSAFERIAKADGSLCVTEAAKALQMRPKDLFDYLSQNNWIYRRPGGKTWLGYSYRCNAGDLEYKVHTALKADGSEKVCERVLATAQGLRKPSKLLPLTARRTCLTFVFATVTVVCSTVTVQASSATLDLPNVHCTGNVTADGDVTAGGISLQKHVHQMQAVGAPNGKAE